MTEQFEQAKREFIVSVMFSVTGEYNPQHPAVSKCLSDLNSLLEQHKEMIIEEVRDELLKHCFPMFHGNRYPSDAVPKGTILELPALLKNVKK